MADNYIQHPAYNNTTYINDNWRQQLAIFISQIWHKTIRHVCNSRSVQQLVACNNRWHCRVDTSNTIVAVYLSGITSTCSNNRNAAGLHEVCVT